MGFIEPGSVDGVPLNRYQMPYETEECPVNVIPDGSVIPIPGIPQVPVKPRRDPSMPAPDVACPSNKVRMAAGWTELQGSRPKWVAARLVTTGRP